MMSIEPRNESAAAPVVPQDDPSYNLQPLLLKRYRELEEARAFNNWLGERRQAGGAAAPGRRGDASGARLQPAPAL